jgi:hypothetical protein
MYVLTLVKDASLGALISSRLVSPWSIYCFRLSKTILVSLLTKLNKYKCTAINLDVTPDYTDDDDDFQIFPRILSRTNRLLCTPSSVSSCNVLATQEAVDYLLDRYY